MKAAGFFFRFGIFALLAPAVCSLNLVPLGKLSSPPLAPFFLLSGDDRPVRNARVELFLEDSSSAISTLTNDKGQFHFAQVSPATCRISVTAPACETF